jgi:hypothetical protein
MPPKKKGKSDPSTKLTTSNSDAQSASRQPPNWPAFQPLIPASDLSLHEQLPNQIITVPNLWTATLCKTYVSFLSSLPLATTPGRPKKGNAVRVNDRFQIDDHAFAERLWSGTALKDLVLGTTDEGTLALTNSQRRELWGGEVVRPLTVPL